MGRIQIAAAVATAFFAVAIIIQLSIGFGRHEKAYFWPLTSQHQFPSTSSSAKSNIYGNETLYLLGLGKADITGQGSHYRHPHSVC